MKPTKIKHDEDKIFVTGCNHYFHNKSFVHGARGFVTVEEHDAALDAEYNKIPEDSVLINLGDFSISPGDKTPEEMTQLTKDKMIFVASKFKKVLWHWGNHRSWEERVVAMNLPELSHVEFCHYSEVQINKKLCILGHYPLASFNGESIRSFALCSHSHGSYPLSTPTNREKKLLDCSPDTRIPYSPFTKRGDAMLWTFAEIREVMKDKNVQVVDHHAPEEKLWSNHPIHKEITDAMYFGENNLDSAPEAPQNPPQ